MEIFDIFFPSFFNFEVSKTPTGDVRFSPPYPMPTPMNLRERLGGLC
jgi:hypothetical protein